MTPECVAWKKDSYFSVDLRSVAKLPREILLAFHRLGDLPRQNFFDGDRLKFLKLALVFQKIAQLGRRTRRFIFSGFGRTSLQCY
jgi:hypothetical protein